MKLIKYLKFWKFPKKIWVTILLIFIGAGGYYLYPKPKEVPILTAEVKTGDVRSIISASGTLEGTDSADLKFKISGKLNYLGVKPGQKVEKGELIASLDSRDLEINLQQAYNTFVSKDATAKRAEDDVKDHSKDENFTQKETRIAAQTARDNAFDDIKAAKRALEDAFIYSPISGIITKADFNPGQIITTTDTIAKIVDETEYVFEAEVDEADIGRVKLEQIASVSLNSYPEKTFEAKVFKVTPITQTTDSGATVVIVKLDLGKPEINFVSGINGQADVITGEVGNVLVIPVEALMDNDEIYVKKGGSFEKVKAEVGLRSDSEAEIKSGVSSGDSVATNPESVKTPSRNWFSKLIGR